MRSVIAVVSSVAMLVAQVPPSFAQNAVSTPAQPVTFSPGQGVSVSPAIVDAFNAFPKGGDQLSKRIADIIVKNPKLATGMVRYLQATPGISREQKLAAEQGLAAALNRLGIKAADMPVKAPVAPVAEEYDWTWLLALAAIAALICIGVCHHESQVTPVPVSPE
jgi:hypothetical protein